MLFLNCDKKSTYAGSLASTDVVAEARDVARITHEDCSGDLLLSSSGDGDSSAGEAFVGVSAPTISIVEDLATLSLSVSLATSSYIED